MMLWIGYLEQFVLILLEKDRIGTLCLGRKLMYPSTFYVENIEKSKLLSMVGQKLWLRLLNKRG